MKFESLLQLVGREPVFETGLLLSGGVDPGYIRRQLSGWVRAGKLWQLRRGLYALAVPYQKIAPHPFLVANRLVRGSYVSLQAALAYHGLIPEHVQAVTSVTTRRPGVWRNPLGQYLYRHIQTDLFYAYTRILVGEGQHAYLATAEKALLDLVYLQPGGDSPAYLEALRLQNLDRLDIERLQRLAKQADKSKLWRAAEAIATLVTAEREAYEIL